MSDPHLAADLTAEVLLAAIGSAPTYRPRRATPAPWLYGIARNVIASEYRRAAREGRPNAQIEGHRLLNDDDIQRMQERIDAASSARHLFVAIANLPASERSLLELVALDDLSVTDAVAELGIRPIAARVRLHRARKTLRQGLAARDAERRPETGSHPESVEAS